MTARMMTWVVFLVMMRLVDLQEMIQVDRCSFKWGKTTPASEHHADNPEFHDSTRICIVQFGPHG